MLWSGDARVRIAFDHRLVGYRLDDDRLLEKAKEQLASAMRLSPVEAECELVQIIPQVLKAHRPLMRSHQPSFEKRDHPVNPRHLFRWSLLLSLQECDLVIVA